MTATTDNRELRAHALTLTRLKAEGIGFSISDHRALEAAIALLTRTEAGADKRVRHSCETDMLSDCAGCAKDAAPVADGIDATELSSLKQRAGAWDAVVETCLQIDPIAIASYGETGRQSIVNFIKQFTHPQDASAVDGKLLAAARKVNALYPLHWDRVDGGAVVMPERIEQFDQAFNELSAALQQTKGAGDV